MAFSTPLRPTPPPFAARFSFAGGTIRSSGGGAIITTVLALLYGSGLAYGS